MSKLYITTSSDSGKTEQTKRGHKEIKTHVRGWTVGVKVFAIFDPITQKESFQIYSTGGSNNPQDMKHVSTITA